MMKSVDMGVWGRLAIMLALLVFPLAPVSAFVDPPTFSPAQPYAGQAIDMSVRVGVCHTFVAPPEEIPFLEVQISGNVVEAIFAGVEANDPIFCVWDIGAITVNIGSLPEGSYTVRVRIRDINPPFNILPLAPEAGLVVLGQPTPVTVPAIDLTALFVLAGLLVLLAIAALKRSFNAFNHGASPK